MGAKRRKGWKPATPETPLPARKIMIGIPCGAGLDYATSVSCANAANEAAALGWQTVQMVRQRDSILVRARDVIVSAFYASDCTDLLFVDSDIAWDPGTFTRLMQHPVEMIGGVYRARGEPPNYVCAPLPEGLNVEYPSGRAEVRGVGTGFLRITRAAVDRLIKALPEDHWYFDEHTAPGLKIWHLFDFTFDATQDPGMRLRSEDYVFCDRFRAAGGKVYVDVDLTLHHLGDATYTGHFGNWLRSGGNGQVTIAPRDGAPVAPPAPAGLSLVEAVQQMVNAA